MEATARRIGQRHATSGRLITNHQFESNAAFDDVARLYGVYANEIKVKRA